jgi:hypothetical protein
MSVEDQLIVMDRMGIDQTVILPLNSPESTNEQQSIGEILLICEKYPGRFIPFCYVDPRLARRPDLITKEDYLYLLRQYKDMGCKGMGEFVMRIPWTDPLMLKLLSAVEEVGFPITFHTCTQQADSYGVIDEMGLPLLEMVLHRFPGVKFFGHSQAFWSEMSGDLKPEEKNGYPKGPVVPGGRLVELMRRYPNLYGDISAGSGCNALSRDEDHAERFIEEFKDRLLFGLDFCSPKNKMPHLDWLNSMLDKGKISKEAYDNITWRNANRVLDLGLE